MANDFEIEQTIFEDLPRANVVNDEVAVRLIGFSVGYNSNVGDSAGKIPTDNVTGLIIFGIIGYFFDLSVPLEIGHQVGNTSMINVLVGLFESPRLGVNRKVA